MTARTSLEVQVWGVRRCRGKRKTTYTVRWKVESHIFQRTFDTIKVAESFRARLLVGIRQAEPFDVRTGQPFGVLDKPTELSWLDHAMAFVDVKWPHASPRHRKGIAEGLTTATVAALPAPGIDSTAIRRALEGWVFNSAARSGSRDSEPPEDHADAVRWARRHSPSLVEMAEPPRLRRVLDALALKLDGTPASSSTVARKRSALYSAFQYAVEVDALPTNPMDRITRKPPADTDEVDRRVVVNPHQAKKLLAEVADIYPSLEAFFACIYYAGLRPSEVRHLKVGDLHLPAGPDAWGTLHVLGSTQTAGPAWTDNGQATEDRSLKHRARRATRQAPAPPELVAVLRRHIKSFPPGVDGRLFVTRAGRAGIPVAAPFASPQSMGIRLPDLGPGPPTRLDGRRVPLAAGEAALRSAPRCGLSLAQRRRPRHASRRVGRPQRQRAPARLRLLNRRPG